MKKSLMVVLIVFGFVLVGCSPIQNKQITYTVDGSVPTVSVAYTSGSGMPVAMDVSLPYTVTFENFNGATATISAAYFDYDNDYAQQIHVAIYIDGKLHSADSDQGTGMLQASTLAY